jgi:hypothetical protein
MKSILFDAAPRSGNHFTIALLRKAFANINLYWGYKYQHNSESFNLPKEKFDCFMTVVRNPIDSIASDTISKAQEDIADSIYKTKQFLESVLQNKDKVHIYPFETLVNNPLQIIGTTAKNLDLEINTVDIEKLKSSLPNDVVGFYVVPVNNQDKLNLAKARLETLEFVSAIAELNTLYRDILS